MGNLTAQDLAGKLRAEGFARSSPSAAAVSDPITDTPMVVTLDELRPYELDPRLTRNPLYDEIKASIRERGLDAPPPITRRPGADHYIVRNGGNTRLSILRELWSETKDDQFFRIRCLFRPWPERGEIVALTGHLAENELHGGLSFIERALGVEKARELYEQESQKPLSQSELARRLTADGYPIQQSHISRMQETVRYLLPAIPTVLYGGLGRRQVERLAVLRKAAELTWEQHAQGKSLSTDFESLFHDVLASFDTHAEAFSIQRVQDELLGSMSDLLGTDYNTLELDVDNIEHRQRAVTSQPQDPSEPATALAPPGPTPTWTAPSTGSQRGEARTPAGDAADDRLQGHIVSAAPSTDRLQAIQQLVAEHTGEPLPNFAENALRAIPVQAGGLFPITDVWYIEPGLDSPDRLRIHIAQFAREIAEQAGRADCIESTDTGIGFACTPPSQDSSSMPAFGRAVLVLLHALSAARVLPASQPHTIADLPLENQLAALLHGADIQRPITVPRLSDNGLVKFFRLLRLARRLRDLETGSHESVP